MALKFDYANSTVKELQPEIDSRKAAGRDINPKSAKKEDLIAALEADDAASIKEGKPPAVKTTAPRPSLDMGDYKPNRDGWPEDDRAKYGLVGFTKRHTPHPDPAEAVKGKKASLQGDGEVYFLRVDEEDPRGVTHHLKNKDHTWKGSKEQFEASFEEVWED